MSAHYLSTSLPNNRGGFALTRLGAAVGRGGARTLVAVYDGGMVARWRVSIGAICASAVPGAVGCADSDTGRDWQGGVRGTLGAVDDAAGFARADRAIALSFPQDHGPHPAFRSEWWYLTAVLATARGREFGVQFTVFRRGLQPMGDAAPATAGAAAWRSGQVYMAHFALSDLQERRHFEDERLARGHPALAGAVAAPFETYVEGWRLASVAPAAPAPVPARAFWPLALRGESREFAVDLTLTGGKPIVAQGDGGLSRKGPNNASYYYSIPRVRALGSVVVDGERHQVAGNAWMDREWSTSVLAPEYAGWDWFALHLDDGRDLMVYRMRRSDGRASGYDSGVLVDADGTARALSAADFSLTPQAFWRQWPVAWRLALRGEDAPWTVEAAFEDQVMTTSITYWEGVAHARASTGERVGSGYMELTGY